MKKKTAIIIIVLLIIAAAAAAVWYFFLRKPVSASADKIFVQSVDSLQSYSGYGNRFNGVVDTQKSEKTEFDTEKKLKELYVSVGDLVKVGDPLFSYDTESISLEIDQLNLEIERLQTDVRNNNEQIAQLSKDIEKVSESDRLEYSAQIAQLQADNAQNEYDVRTKQSEIKRKQASIDNSTVLCEMDGRITEIASVEDIIAGTNLDESGSPSNVFITTLAEGDFRIKGTVSETNISEISVGMAITARSRTDESRTWTGTVESIDTQNTASNNNSMMYDSGSGNMASKYSFYVELDSTDGLMIGQHLILEPTSDVDVTSEGIWLESGWLVTEEDGSVFVWAAPSDGAKLEKREVKTGRYLEDTDQNEILSGLTLNDFIAWPDESCAEGAPTTSEIVIPEEDAAMTNTEGPITDEGPIMEEGTIMDEEIVMDDEMMTDTGDN